MGSLRVDQASVPDGARLLERSDCGLPIAHLSEYLGLPIKRLVAKLGPQPIERSAGGARIAEAMLGDRDPGQVEIHGRLERVLDSCFGNPPQRQQRITNRGVRAPHLRIHFERLAQRLN